MKKYLILLRNLFIRIKVFFARSSSYISMVNTSMILFLFLSNLEKYGIDVRIENLIIPLILLGIAIMIAFGYIEDKLGFYQQEKRTTESRSPYLKEIIDRLERIEKKL